MKYAIIILLIIGCNTSKQLERAVAKVDRCRKILEVKQPETWPKGQTLNDDNLYVDPRYYPNLPRFDDLLYIDTISNK